jgi:N4-gp56 family major capsid protein
MLNYNAPTQTNAGTAADIEGAGSGQMATFFYLKKAIIEARKEQYFMPLASAVNMPKHFGKTIKIYEYVPLLDERNINDMGLDAAGATIADGNLYGSSKDIGTITSKLPVLSENGGRVNRVGFTRLSREGSIAKFGFFTEFTAESLDFDSDDMLMDHLSRELMNGAVQITEAVLQKDLLASPGIVLFAGAATTNGTITGEGGTPSIVDYGDLMRLDQLLTDNRTPKHTKVITGSRLVDTKTLPAARVMFIGSELVPLVKAMKDLFLNAAFIPIQQYGDAGTVLNGEIGTVDAFRIVVVPEMLHWADVGATVTGGNLGYRNTGGNYDVFPMLVVGDDSFSTIGFQTDGKTVKFSVMTKMPGKETADRNDPYGETGFSSIKWYYGILVKRPERIALIKTVAPI